MANFNPNEFKIYNGRFDQTKHNRLVDQLLRQHLKPGPNYQLYEGSGGIVIIPSAQGTATSIHPYTVFNASVKTVPNITVTPGTHNGITPTIYGIPINTKIGTPPAYPVLTLGSSDATVYLEIDYNSSNQITTIEISSCTSAEWTSLLANINIVPGTSGTDYKLLSTLTIVYASDTGYATVMPNNDGLSGPQGYGQCGTSSNVWLV